MHELRALIFDVDGTLADTERDGHRVAFNAAFRDLGLDWNWTEEIYGDLLNVTGGKERIEYYQRQYHPQTTMLPLDIIHKLHRAKTDHYMHMLAMGAIPLRSGVKRLLNEAKKENLRLAIATTTTMENVTALLTHTLGAESINWFEVIAAGDSVPAKKPAPDVYVLVLNKLELSPQACLAFEDSSNGINASTAAGLKTIITVNDYTYDHDFTGACLVVDQFGEPDDPFKVLQGKAHHHRYVNLDLLKQIV